MKKVLFITAFTPSDIAAAEKNTKILLEDMGSSFHVDLIYARYDTDVDYTPHSQNIYVIKVFKNSKWLKIANVLLFPLLYPIYTVRFNRTRLRELQQIVDKGNYSAIVFEHNQNFLFAKYLRTSVPKLLYCHDVMFQRVSRVHGWLVSSFCKWSEKFCFKIPNSSIYAISQKDCNMIKELYGFDAYPALAYIEPQIISSKPSEIYNDDYAFMANWKRSDNIEGLVWFFEKVAPLIDFPVRINIVGKNLNYKYDESNPNVKVNYMGFVDNPYPFISNCRAFLSPLFTGAGVKQKVFEALACGVPVIGNDIAFEGIDSSYEKYMLKFNDEKDFVECMRKDISLSERLKLKEDFTLSYHSKTIPVYIQEIVTE